MILTTKNYYEFAKDVDFPTLPKEFQEMHEIIEESTEHGKDWSLYNEDKEAMETLQLYFDKIVPYIDKQKVKKESKISPKRKLHVDDDVIDDDGNGYYVFREMPFNARFNDFDVSVKEVNPKMNEIGKEFIFSEKNLIKLKDIEDAVKNKNSKSKKQKPAGHNTKKQDTDQGDFVEAVSLEVKYIKRYVNLNGKTHAKKSIYNLLTSLQKDILLKKIRKTSDYAKEITEIQNNLLKVYNSMGASIKIEIDSKKIDHLTSIAGSEKQMLSVALIKRFLNLYKKPEKAKAEKLLKDVETALDKGTVPQHCPYIKEVKFVEKSLNDYISSGTIEIETYELHGLMGCCEMKTLSGVDDNTCINSMDMAKMNFNTIGLDGDFKCLLGDPTEPFSMMIFGGPGSGKSTLAIQLAHELAAKYNKPVAYVAKEEGTGATLKEKFQRMNAFHPLIDIYEDMPKDVKKYKYIFVDSANEMRYNCDDLQKLIEKYNPESISFVFVFKGTKDGSYRGTQDNEHLVDISIKCKNGIATTEKSRYGGTMKDEKNGFKIY